MTAENLTPDSIARLYAINDIRNSIIENEPIVADLRVTKIVAFGSSVNGNAKETSDTDIFVLYKRPTGEDYDNLDQYFD